MAQGLGVAIALLQRTPATRDGRLRGSHPSWVRGREGTGTRCPVDAVSHLIHAGRTNWLPSIQALLRRPEPRPLPSSDRFGLLEVSAGRSPERGLDELTAVPAQSLTALRRMDLTPDGLLCRGHHPAPGVVTVPDLLAAWAVHDPTHLHQVSGTLAHRERGAAGPFAESLGVLACDGNRTA